MAMSWCVRRAAASSWLIRSAASSLNRIAFSSASSSSLFASRFLPFSTFSAFNSPNSTPDKLSLLDGLPFDSVKVDHEDRSITLRRETKDEIIQILVTRGYYDTKKYVDGDGTNICVCVQMSVKIFYGINFKKCTEFNLEALPDDLGGQIVVRSVRMSVDDVKETHVDELGGFLEKRGLNHDNLNFMIKYAMERKANLEQVHFSNI